MNERCSELYGLHQCTFPKGHEGSHGNRMVPKSPQTSRELVECIRKLLGVEIYNLESNEPWRNVATLIELYVKAEAAKARRDQFVKWEPCLVNVAHGTIQPDPNCPCDVH